MANRRRGEISTVIGGERRSLCLTLGALAELEDAFGVQNLSELGAKFEKGGLSAKDCITIIGCGLRGAGEDISDHDLAGMTVGGGLKGWMAIVAELLKAAFNPDGSDAGGPPVNP